MALQVPYALHDWLEERDSLRLGDDPDPTENFGEVVYYLHSHGYDPPTHFQTSLGGWPKNLRLPDQRLSMDAYREDCFRLHLVWPDSRVGIRVNRVDEFWTVRTVNGQKISLLLFTLTVICFEWFLHPVIDDVLGHLYTI